MTTRDDAETTARQPFPIWCGLTLGNWLRLLARRPDLHWSRAGRIAAVTSAACVNSVLALVERAAFSRRVARVRLEHPPIFILGHWRSGTSLLQSLLSRDPQFAAPTLFRTSFPEHFLLSEAWLPKLTARLLPATRPMDNMPYAWNVPGEDEVALMLMTLHSPYLLPAFPDRPEKIARFENLRRGLSEAELARWQDCFLWFLRKLTLKDPKPLVLKSPTHTGRLPLLLQMFPKARFIHIVRNPYDVFCSTLHLQRMLCAANALGRAATADLEERVLSTYLALYHAYHLYRPLVPPQQLFELRFEDLVADPLAELRRLYAQFDFAGIEQLPERLESELQRHLSYRRNVYSLNEETRRRIAERWRPAFKRYGYAM